MPVVGFASVQSIMTVRYTICLTVLVVVLAACVCGKDDNIFRDDTLMPLKNDFPQLEKKYEADHEWWRFRRLARRTPRLGENSIVTAATMAIRVQPTPTDFFPVDWVISSTEAQLQPQPTPYVFATTYPSTTYPPTRSNTRRWRFRTTYRPPWRRYSSSRRPTFRPQNVSNSQPLIINKLGETVNTDAKMSVIYEIS